MTPGFGIRYFTPIGPVRVDLAYRFAGGRELAVYTTELREYAPPQEGTDSEEDRLRMPDGDPGDWVRGDNLLPLIPPVMYGESPAWSLRRVQLHLSIGQAF